MSTTIASPANRRRNLYIAGAVVIALIGGGFVYAGVAGGEPPIIRIASGGGGEATQEAAAMADDADGRADMMIWNPATLEFELADSARIDAGEAAAWRLNRPDDLRAAIERIAEHFDLDGVAESPYGDEGFYAGSTDGTGPSLWVGPSGDWWFNDPTGQPVYECAESGSDREGGGVDSSEGGTDTDPAEDDPAVSGPAVSDLPERCTEPTPPENVPSESQARDMAAALFDDLGVSGDLTAMEVSADDWGAWVYAQLEVGGQPSGLSFSAGYGANGVLTSAGGTLATPENVGDYPTVDAETALERLQSQQIGWAQSLRTSGDEVEIGSPDATVSSEVMVDPAVSGPAAPSEGEPEVIKVTLVEVERILTMIMDVDDVLWLVPAYRFTGDDGGVWEVVAVAEGYVELPDDEVQVEDPDLLVDPPVGEEPPVAEEPPSSGGGQEPMPVEPAPGEDQPAPPPEEIDPNPGEDPAPPLGADPELEALAREVVGLSEEEATRLIEGAGGAVRVVARDGESFAVTDDYRLDRVNLHVQGGVVTEASIG